NSDRPNRETICPHPYHPACSPAVRRTCDTTPAGDGDCPTQSKPLSNIYNFGGFSDGDRCVFLAHAFGARNITLIGFYFEDENVTEMKKKKLRWARKLIGMIPGVINRSSVAD
ncbi:MAG: hypothetical protein O8C66_13440, partial [Candidatus Methanoperedens sp.]|nr:hypothetical protein [Candidatus Methanoperedens sp.]